MKKLLSLLFVWVLIFQPSFLKAEEESAPPTANTAVSGAAKAGDNTTVGTNTANETEWNWDEWEEEDETSDDFTDEEATGLAGDNDEALDKDEEGLEKGYDEFGLDDQEEDATVGKQEGTDEEKPAAEAKKPKKPEKKV